MSERDWAAWVAVKAIVQSALRTQGADFPELAAFLRSDKLNVDGAKGPALSFRAWNNQLRQPILLSTHDAMIARAPIEGFLHPRNTLDTLGDDATESRCRLSAGAQAND
jgi:ABC transporter substrate binding protein (PQQ-dependent alcohol dehydrogenase system)